MFSFKEANNYKTWMSFNHLRNNTVVFLVTVYKFFPGSRLKENLNVAKDLNCFLVLIYMASEVDQKKIDAFLINNKLFYIRENEAM